jgi:hypothetical protein
VGQRIGEGDHGHKAVFIIWGQIVPLAETPSCQGEDANNTTPKMMPAVAGRAGDSKKLAMVEEKKPK